MEGKTNLWYELKISVENAVRSDFDTDNFLEKTKFSDKPAGIWKFQDEEMYSILNQEWIYYLKQCNIPVTSFMMFYRQPNYQHPEAHIDVHRPAKPTDVPLLSVFGLNLVISKNDDSYMSWYDVSDFEKSKEMSKTLADTPYLSWPMSEVQNKEIDRVIIGNRIVLVNVGVPHNVIMNNNERWLISLRCRNSAGLKNWDEAINYFSKYIK